MEGHEDLLTLQHAGHRDLTRIKFQMERGGIRCVEFVVGERRQGLVVGVRVDPAASGRVNGRPEHRQLAIFVLHARHQVDRRWENVARGDLNLLGATIVAHASGRDIGAAVLTDHRKLLGDHVAAGVEGRFLDEVGERYVGLVTAAAGNFLRLGIAAFWVVQGEIIVNIGSRVDDTARGRAQADATDVVDVHVHVHTLFVAGGFF